MKPATFERAEETKRESEDSFDEETDEESEVEEQSLKVKRMSVKYGRDMGAIYDPKQSNKLKGQREGEENIPLAKRLSAMKHKMGRNVAGGKVFTLEKKTNQKGTFLQL